MLLYYILLVILSAINLIIYITKQDRRSDSNISVVFYISFISTVGYLTLATSTNIETALLANKIIYFGGCFLLPHILFATLRLCNYTIPRLLTFLVITVNVIMFASVLSIGHLNIFYKSNVLKHAYGISYIEKEYGFMHTLYYIILFAYILIVLGLIVHTRIKHKRISFRSMLLFAAISCLSIFSFLFGKLLPKGIEIVPLIYILCEWIFLYITNRISMYDIEMSISNSLQLQQTYGYVTFDLKKNFLGCNKIATNFFPDLYNLKIDFPIENKESLILKTISQWIDEFEDVEIIKKYHENGKYYDCTLKSLYHNRTRCGYLLEIIDTTDREKYIHLLNNYNLELAQSVEEKTAHIVAMHDKILFAMGNMIENRDSNTGGHIYRTSHVVQILVNAIRSDNRFDLPASFYHAVVKYAPLHDLGKISIDDSILCKPDKLTPEEFDIIKTHTDKGAAIVTNILEGVEEPEMITIAYNIARYHHEKWDGSGYPCQLSGTSIPFEARIMAIADCYDALVTKRCYKDEMSYDDTYNYIKNSFGSLFDPELFIYFDKCRKQLEQYYESQAI